MAGLLALTLMENLAVLLFILVCVTLVLIILLQKGRGGGIGAAFGGGAAGSLLGTKTGDFLTWVTICLVAGFLVLSVLLGKFIRPQTTLSDLSAPVAAEATKTDQNATAGTETAGAPAPADTATSGTAQKTTPAPEKASDDVAKQPAGDNAPKPEPSNENNK